MRAVPFYKHRKAVARQMVTTTRAVNEQKFAGQARVRCYTCHHAQAKPLSAPAFQ